MGPKWLFALRGSRRGRFQRDSGRHQRIRALRFPGFRTPLVCRVRSLFPLHLMLMSTLIVDSDNPIME